MIQKGQSAGVSLSELMQLDEVARAALCTDIAIETLASACIEQLQGLAMQDLEHALNAVGWVIARADETDSGTLKVQARTAGAFALSLGNQFEEATVLLKEAESQAASLDDLSRGRVAQAWVQPLARLGRLTEATTSAERAIVCFELADEYILAAKAHTNLGIVQRMRENPAAAIHHFDKALPMLVDQPTAVAQLQNNRAEALLELAEFASAERAFKLAMLAFDEGSMGRAAAVAQGNLADLLGMQGKFAEALRHFEHARRRLEDGNAPGDAARLAAERAEVLSLIGLPEEAVEACLQATASLDKTGLKREAARARMATTIALVRSGRLKEAEVIAREAAAQFAAVGAEQALAKANVLLANIESRRGCHDAAISLLTDARNSLRNVPIEKARTGAMLASILLDAGRAKESLQEVELALSIAEQLDLAPLRADMLHTRARAQAKLGERDAAIVSMRKAIDEVERLRGLLQADRLRVAWLGDRVSVYSDLVSLLLERRTEGDVATAFEMLERSKSRSLLDLVDGGSRLAESVIERDTSDRDTSASELVERLLASQAELNALYSAIDRQDVAVQDNESQLRSSRMRRLEQEIARTEGQLSATRRFGPIFTRSLELSTLQRTLGDHDGLVSYFGAAGQIGVLVVRSDRVHAIPVLCTEKQAEALQKRLLFQLNRAVMSSASSTDDERTQRLIDRELHVMHQLLIAPIAGVLDGLHSLTILPHGRMYALPFHLLRGADGLLLEGCDVSVAPSASIAHHMATHHRALTQGRALVVGVADEQAPQIADEAVAVAVAIPGCQTLIGADATAEAFLTQANGASLIHLACHGHFPAGDPLEARFKLADRWVTAREIFALDLHGSTVILSCCDVGRSRVAEGDEIFGLTRAFLASGVSALVTSLWPAHDATTRTLISDFYKGLVQGQSVTKALCGAQRNCAKRNDHPAQWGHFVSVGMP